MDKSFIIDDINKINLYEEKDSNINFNKNNLSEQSIFNINNEDISIDENELPELLTSNEVKRNGIKNNHKCDYFNPEEDEKQKKESIKVLEEVNEKLKIINKIKIDRDYFYKKMNYNYLYMISQNIFIRNIITFKFNSEITFYALDLQFCKYDLFIDKTFANTIDWVNYIEKYYDK